LVSLGHMNKEEARAVARAFLANYRAKPYVELAALIGSTQTVEVTTPSGTRYQLELQAFWDDPAKPHDVVRVSVAIDDGRLRAFVPLCESFLIAPDGAFVGEDVA